MEEPVKMVSGRAQLQPETIVPLVADSEDRTWHLGGLTDDREDSLSHDSTDMGHVILQHGRSVKHIHSYFAKLEQRKCCLLLAACRKRFTSVRLVRSDGRDSGIEEGAMMKTTLGDTDVVVGLDEVDFKVFQNAIMCAAFPVLGAPEPPTGATPSPKPLPAAEAGKKLGLLLTMKSPTPGVLTDSGVEDAGMADDVALVPAETLCELLRRAYRLARDRFAQYEEIVATQMEKKSPQKILAEELVRQLVALENNSNPFYNPKTFLNRHGYDTWQQKERTHITDLLNKFWHFSLPEPSAKSMPVVSVHLQYKLLMEKLIRYESPYRQQSEILAPPPKSPLSSASVCLLKEFSLRYGVGDQYTKIAYLHHLAVNFDPTVWFIQHITMSLTSVLDAMPNKRSFLVIVKEEYTVLETSLQLLDTKAPAAIAKMKTLFTEHNPTEGIESLIELVALVIKARSYLVMQPEEQLGTKLFKVIQTIFPTIYERHKITSKDELRHNKREVGLSPKLINMLIGHIRDEVQDFRQNFQQAFQRFFNITVEAAQEFYRLLMADVAELLKHCQDRKRVMEIDKLMLSLAYRLNQLDNDWSVYIGPQLQTWREAFMVEAQHWSTVLKYQMHSCITQAVASDKYSGCEVQWVGSLHQNSSSRSTRNRTVSSSFNPSENSAFSSLSSVHSQQGTMPVMIHHQPSIPEAFSEHTPKQKSPKFPVQGLTDTPCDIKSPLFDRRPSSDPVNISHSSMLSGSYLGDMARSLGHYDDQQFLTFTRVRPSSSLPDIHTGKRYIEMVPTSRRTPGEEERKNKSPFAPLPTRKASVGGEISPEISDLLKDPVSDKGKDDDDSEESGTLTDESGSPDVDMSFEFPPILEIKATTPVSHAEIKPVTAMSDMVGDSSIIRPLPEVVKPSTSGVTKIKGSLRIGATHSRTDNNVRLSDKPNISNSGLGYQSHVTYDMSADHGQLVGSLNTQDGFTDSLGSNISFPHPATGQDNTVASVPMSSSAVDIIVILQRIVGTGKALCRTLTPYRFTEDSDHSNLSSALQRESFFPPSLARCRNKLYDNFLSAIRSVVCVFADNMLCMDLCGTSNAMARRLAGPQLVQYLQTQQASQLIWGCRHDLHSNKNCFEYLDKQSALLCDRHEPITRDMCTRINNVSVMLTCLEWYHRHLGNVFGIFSDLSVKQLRASMQSSVNSLDILRSEFVMVEDYGYDPSKDKAEVMETASQLAPSVRSGVEGSIVVTSPTDPDRDHLKALLRAQCRIMAYRLNLFVRDALPVLLTLKSPTVSLDVGLKPVTDFLASYVLVLNQWLYKDSFIRVLECLWIFIVQDFESELGKLEASDDDTERKGQLLLQSLAHFLKFMNSQNENLKRDLLLSQAEDVSFRLSLYSLPASQLITVYRGLARDVFASESSSIDSDYLHSVLIVRGKLKRDLQKLRKGFGGTELVTWILENQELFANFDPILSESCMKFTSDTAILVAQQLMDWGLIADVEGDRSRGSPTMSMESFEFPDMTIHTEVKVTDDRACSPASDDSTPQATPRATPKPSHRTNLRALSRQSGLKSITPGLLASRSQRSTQGHYRQNRSLETSCTDSKHTKLSATTYSEGAEHRDVDLEIAEVLESAFGTERREVSFHGNSQEVTSLDSLDANPHYNFEYSNGREQVSFDYDPYLRDTPMSVGSGISCESRAPRFIASSDKFYYVCPNVGNELETSLKNYELFQLVEECFQKKITPEYILRIVYSRRKTDSKARHFFKVAPAHLLNSVRYQEDVSFCASS